MNLPVLNGPVKQDIPVMCEGVSVFLIKGTGRRAQTLLMRRAKTLKGTWCQVAGSIEKGETACPYACICWICGRLGQGAFE